MLKLTQEIQKAHKEYIWCIKFHPLENIFASCGNDKIVSIFEYSSLEKKYIKTSILSKTHKKTIRSLFPLPRTRTWSSYTSVILRETSSETRKPQDSNNIRIA